MVGRKKVQISPHRLCPERFAHCFTAGWKGRPTHPDSPGTGSTTPPHRTHCRPSAQQPRTLSRVLAFPLRNDRARGGGGDGHPSLPGVLRGADQSAPQRPGPRWPLLPPRTPPLPRPGASTRRHEAREASRPPPQGPGRVPEQGLRMRVVCVARAGRRVHRQRRAGRRGDWRRGWPSWAAQSAPPRRVLAGAGR